MYHGRSRRLTRGGRTSMRDQAAVALAVAAATILYLPADAEHQKRRTATTGHARRAAARQDILLYASDGRQLGSSAARTASFSVNNFWQGIQPHARRSEQHSRTSERCFVCCSPRAAGLPTRLRGARQPQEGVPAHVPRRAKGPRDAAEAGQLLFPRHVERPRACTPRCRCAPTRPSTSTSIASPQLCHTYQRCRGS